MWHRYKRPEAPPEDYVPQEGPESTPFTEAIEDAVVRRTPAPLRNSVMALIYKPEMLILEAVT